MIDRSELSAWLRLLLSPQVGPVAVRKLLAVLGSPQAVFDAPAPTLRQCLSAREVQALGVLPEGHAALLESTWAWLHAAPLRHVLTLADPRYPPALLEAPDPPFLLHAQGRLDLLQRPAVAVVGSRNPTRQGRDNARAFAAVFSQAGLTVVSGLALGIDGAAHEGALEGAGSTVAVVGTGLDSVYPQRHQELAQRVAEHGVLLSEYPLGTPPLAQNFPRRNRIIAGLSQGVLVVEAALRSGSLQTARLGADMARDVFAVPGSIHSPQSRGCHALIKQGAKLVETAQDVLEELRCGLPGGVACGAAGPLPSGVADQAAPDPDGVLAALGFDPVGLDALAARTGLSPAALSSRLLDLELEGRVARLPGQLFQRVATRLA